MRFRRHKYGAVETVYNGQRYDSKGEADYARDLDLKQRAGLIARWERGKDEVILEGPTLRQRVSYRPDFIVYENDGTARVVDFKGVVTAVFRIKALLWQQKFPRLPIWVADKRGERLLFGQEKAA